MGACASMPKAMRAKATDSKAPEPREEEISAAVVAEETTVAAVEKVGSGNDSSPKKEEKVEIESPKVVRIESEMEAPTPPKPVAAAVENQTPAEEQKNIDN